MNRAGVVAVTALCLAWPACGGAQTAPSRPLDLEAVVARALGANAGYRASLARRQEVAGGVEEAGADAWPQVDLKSNWSRARNPSLLNSPDFDDILEQFPDFEPGEQELWSLAVELEQPLYTGGKVRAAVELAELAVDITEARIGADRLDLALRCAEVFYDLLLAEDAITTLEVQQQARREALEVVLSRYEIGEATELERLRAKAFVAELGPVLAGAEGDVAIAESRLRALLGLEVAEPVVLLAPERGELPEVPGFEHLWAIAGVRRPGLAELVLQIEALERQKQVTVADGRPQLELKGAYGRQVRLLEDLEDSLFADWRVSLGFSWNLFDGGRRSGQVAQLESRREQLRFQLEDLRRTMRADLQRELVGYRSARARLAAATSSAAVAAEAARVAAESYSQGVALQADLLDASDQEVRQRLAADQARYDSLRAAARLRRAAGLLPTEPFDGGDG